MEKRKVQMTGGSSYIITLPKDWVKDRGIRKNDVLEISTNPDGSLLIVPERDAKKDEKILSIDCQSIKDPAMIFRMLVGGYIRGYTSIEVRQSPSIPTEIQSVVRRFVRNTVGVEIIEADEKRIEIKDLLDPSEMPPERTIKRMYMLVKNMHEDAVFALMNAKMGLLNEMNERDMEIDRLYWLIAHQYNSISCNRKTAAKMNMDPNNGVYYFITAKTIERIGDHAVRISENAMRILESGVEPEILADLKKASAMSIEIFTKSIDSWMRKDMVEANNNIDSVKDLVRYCSTMAEKIIKEKGMIVVALNNIIESIRRTGEYSADISEMTINYLVK